MKGFKTVHWFYSLIAAFILLFTGILSANAATFTVNDTGDAHDNNLGDGLCATAGAVCTLRAAIDEVNMAAGGHTIVIPAGTYTITGAADEDLNVSGDYDIRDSVTITGAGSGSTFIDGGGLDRVFHITGAYTVSITGVTIRNGNNTLGGVAVKGAGGGIFNLGALTLTNCIVTSNTTTGATSGHGGGILSNGTSLAITNSTISSNTATNLSGGGIFVQNGSLTITNSTITGNIAGSTGGGFYDMAGSAATITNSTISNNTAPSVGGMFMENAQLTITGSTISGNSATGTTAGGVQSFVNLSITNSTISNNTAVSGGGGVYAYRTLSISGSTISGNNGGTAGGGIRLAYDGVVSTNANISTSTISGNTAGGTGGGGIYNLSAGAANTSVVTVTDTTISGNSGNAGAGIRNSGAGATATISKSTLNGNTSGAQGGALYNDTNATATLTNSTISGNSSTASDGGGVYTTSGSVAFNNCTITNNDAATNTDGVYRTGGNLSFTNTIIAGNGGGDDCTGSYAGASSGNNLDSDNTCVLNQGTDLPGSALANLGALAGNGGSTQTHALLAGSAAIGAGSCVLPTDQRGIARPQGATCDIGAFELQQFTVTPSAGAGGTINPSTPQTIASGSTTTFTVTPNAGYTASVGGTCGGTLAGTTYTTNAITADCTVAATFTQTCSYSISPTSQSFDLSGGAGSVNVTATSGCSWTAVSNASWAGITSGSSGSGNGSVSFTIAANSGASRTGSLTIAGNTLTVTQTGVQYTLVVTKSGTGHGYIYKSGLFGDFFAASLLCGADCSAEILKYDIGTSINLYAVPETGATFKAWSGGGCSGAGVCTVTLNADTSVNGAFSPVSGPSTDKATSTLETIGSDIYLKTPIVKYTDPVKGTTAYYSLELVYMPTNDNIIWLKLTKIDELTDISVYSGSQMSQLYQFGNDWILHLTTIDLNGTSLWADLKYIPTNDGKLWFTVEVSGVN